VRPDPFTIAKLALAGVGVLLFLYGIRSDNDVYRWVAIGLVGAAFALRFLRR
jgi:hypothetical protein